MVSAALVASVVALVVRLRRARGAERDQIKWVVLAATLVGVVLPASAALWTVWAPIQLLAAVVLVLLPISACVAILRHRLYDIDLVIVRTVAYALIATLLAAVYVAVTLVAAGFLSGAARRRLCRAGRGGDFPASARRGRSRWPTDGCGRPDTAL